MAKRATASDRALISLRERGLAYPGAHTKSPWPGRLDLAVKDKTFAYLSLEGEPFSIGCKLPESSAIALELPFCAPTPYGLGKSGWVTAKVPEGEEVPVEMFAAWIEESYRAQAPKKLVAELDRRAGDPRAIPSASESAPAKKRTAKKAPAKKRTAKKTPGKKTPAKKTPAKKRP